MSTNGSQPDWIADCQQEVDRLYAIGEGNIGWDVHAAVMVTEFVDFYLHRQTASTQTPQLADPTLRSKLYQVLSWLWADREQSDGHAQFCRDSAEEIKASLTALANPA